MFYSNLIAKSIIIVQPLDKKTFGFNNKELNRKLHFELEIKQL